MDRNALCFCGSGKKQKYCHSDIEPSSIFADLIRLYQKIDCALTESENPSNCHKGCDSCCKQFFLISSTEFLYTIYGLQKMGINIEKFLKRGDDQWDHIKQNYPKAARILEEDVRKMNIHEYEEHSFNLYKESLEICLPCMFLNQSDRSCSIYNYRPLICRYHGLGYIDDLPRRNDRIIFCDNYPYGFEKNKLVDLSGFGDEIFELSVFHIRRLKLRLVNNIQPMFLFCKSFYRREDDLKGKLEEMSHYSKAILAEKMYKRNI